MKPINLILIGLGLHARRTYLPLLLSKLKDTIPVNLKLCIDLKNKEKEIRAYLLENKFNPDIYFVQSFDTQKDIPREIQNYLNSYIKQNVIHGVIITTEPLSHKVYAKWAISQNLHILMDKPITTRENAVSDIVQAKGIYDDYQELRRLYEKKQLEKSTIFSINVQRRYEVGHNKVFQLIKEVADKFNAPVSSIQSSHADGVWILPDEIVTQDYHPYNRGYGKCSHSGYHIIDVVWQYYLAGKVEDKFADSAEITSSFLLPNGLLKQYKKSDYEKYFTGKYHRVNIRNEKELIKLYKNFGEIDAFTIIKCIKDSETICNMSINLLHNSFSRRAWLLPNKDLYKGNGRVKNQYCCIQQGPFQCIQVHNYQSKAEQSQSTIDDYKVGGNNHFDIYVFRNAEMFGKNEVPFKIYSLKDLIGKKDLYTSGLYHESAKELVLREFISFIQGTISKSSLKSNITSHDMPAKILSAMYQSHVHKSFGGSPYIKIKI